jgi:Tetratricopeptide repeat
VAYSNRGNAHKRQGDIDRAIADFSEAIRLDPTFAEAFANRGLLKLKRGDANANDDIANAKTIKPALTPELTRPQALITDPPGKLENVPLPRPRPIINIGPTTTSAFPTKPPSIQTPRQRQPAACPPDQVCQ